MGVGDKGIGKLERKNPVTLKHCNLGIRRSKKGQFLIFSTVFFVLLLLFIYSQETVNSYIIKPNKNNILNNVVYETCQIGKMSNGSYIDSRFGNFTQDVDSYCNSFGYLCNLTITKQVGAPTNLSLLNYTFYDYDINYSNDGFYYSSNFTC